MATSIVIELQQLASDPKATVTDVLRKALMVATKLKINDFKEWVENEMGGYRGKKVPPYRIAVGTPSALNPVTRQWMPIFFDSNEVAQSYSVKHLFESISEMESLTAHDGTISIDYSAEHTLALNSQSGMPIPFKCSCFISKTNIVGILNAVRDIVLQWSLKLEEQGIMGEGMTFSAEERATAANNPTIHIQNFTGQFRQYSGSTDNSTNTVNVNPSTVFNEIRQAIEQVADKRERDQALATIDAIEKAPSKKAGLEKLATLMSLTANSVKVSEAVSTYLPKILAFVQLLAS